MYDDLIHELKHPSHTTQIVLLVLFSMLVAWNVLLLSLATGQRFRRKRSFAKRARVRSTSPIALAPVATPPLKEQPGILRSTVLMVVSLIAVAIVGLALLVGYRHFTHDDFLSNPDTISEPSLLLGQALDPDLSSTLRQVLDKAVKDEGFGADLTIGAYGGNPRSGILVLSNGTNGERLSVADVDDFARVVTADTRSRIGPFRAAPVGRLGGTGRCAVLNDKIGRADVCIYLRAQTSLFLMIDYGKRSAASAAARSLSARNLIVHPAAKS